MVMFVPFLCTPPHNSQCTDESSVVCTLKTLPFFGNDYTQILYSDFSEVHIIGMEWD